MLPLRRRLQSPVPPLAETPSHTDPSSPDSASPLPSSVAAPGHPVGPPEYGSLHLQPCTLDSFFTIDRSTYGLYDLIDGVLIAHEMPTEKHDRQAHFSLSQFNERQRAGHVPPNVRAALAPSVAIPQPNPNSTASLSVTHGRGQSYSLRHPDFAYGQKLTENERKALSPSSRKVTFPLGSRVDFVLECTSLNRRTDMVEKPEEYDRRHVGKYVIIDNDLPHEDDPQRHQPAVYHVSMGHGRAEIGQPVTGDATVSMGYCGHHRARDLLSAPSPSASPLQNARNERHRLEDAESKRKEAEEQARRGDFKRMRERRKKQKYKALARKRGDEVSDSSTSSSSPPRKQKRTKLGD
eukprot:gb/GEZJ01000354.1/.p2 GENE.gb/GEZJ01000354.1/~~gb/GEZJ01000354.1/.p2  ORF type:complete len:351 (+),score=41.87 gb/GEZJ01000354.1/:134-1186(+)